MKFTSWFLNFDFGGRARRSHMWANWAAWVGVLVVLLLVMGNFGQKGTPAPTAVGVIAAMLLFAAIICSTIDGVAMTFRRAHDTGRSGWIWLLLLIPIVNLLPLYWLLIEDSNQGPNKYGPPVKRFYQPETA